MSEGYNTHMVELVMALRAEGVSDKAVLSAVERTPRDLFVPDSFKNRAYEDRALPIDCGQTISQPYVVAKMTEALEVNDRSKVLEIGTGSGYQAAILARLARRVYTIERYRTLAREAKARFDELRLTTIVQQIGDGSKGWPDQAPFDRIIVTAAAESRPDMLLAQLKEDGICVAPVQRGAVQTLIRYRRSGTKFYEERMFDVRFVPLVEGAARAL